MKKDYIFELEDVWKVYRMNLVKTEALRGVSLKIEREDYVALFGPSGSGKSTLMHIMGCLDTPTKGKVLFDGKDISKLTPDMLALIRRDKIGFIFQSYNLVGGFDALENVAMPMRFKGVSKIEALSKSKDLLESVGLGDRLNHKPNELSGGQQQRVAIARALANDPEVILADEPTGNLDTKTGDEITKILHEFSAKEDTTVIVVTHDPDLAKKASRQVLIKDGQIAETHAENNMKKYAGSI